MLHLYIFKYYVKNIILCGGIKISDFNLKEYKDIVINSKEYYLIFLIFISLSLLSIIHIKNIQHPGFEVITFFIVAVLGIFCISFYFKYNSNQDLYKVAFVIIVCFGLICSVILPICDVSDEGEHLVRAELTSEGVIFPHWTGEDQNLTRLYNVTDGDIMKGLNKNVGYLLSINTSFFVDNLGATVFTTNHDTDKIELVSTLRQSAFEQNPFFGYLPQALGMVIAKLLDLNVIWLMWLGRICNLLCYAGLISYAIKKTPYLKIPMLVVSCIPITIYQASSLSIDSMIFGLGILSIAYFIYMVKAPKNSIKNKELVIFTVICLLLGLCKLPYLAFIFLLFLVPKDNVEDKRNFYKIILISLLSVSIIGLMWSQYSSPTLMHSWRSNRGMNSTAQVNYLLTNPHRIIDFFTHIFTDNLVKLANQFFNFYNGGGKDHYQDHYTFITVLLQIFLALILFIYPKKVKFERKTRIGLLLLVLMIYVGTCVIQLFTWAPVGSIRPSVSIRYFIPLLVFFPIIFGLNKERIEKHLDGVSFSNTYINNYSIVFVIGFLATLLLAFATKYY